MFIAMAPSKPFKLRRSGMCSRWIAHAPEFSPCRSYGVLSHLKGLYYKHGAPNGALSCGNLDAPRP